MGRNLIPKLGEWREGQLYRFRNSDNKGIPEPASGKMLDCDDLALLPETRVAR